LFGKVGRPADYSSKKRSLYLQMPRLRTIATALTIPCAVLPIIIAVTGIIFHASCPVFFKGDILVFLPVAVFYGWGILLNYHLHKNIFPLFLLALSLGLMAACWYLQLHNGAFATTLMSFIFTSVANQYLVNEKKECTTCKI
jgi:hypothetical protein